MSSSNSFELSTLDGINGFVLNGVINLDRSGRSVSSAGDVNGDGIDDLIIGAPNANSGGHEDAGESYVVFGKQTGFDPSFNLANLSEADGFVINGANEGDLSGFSVSGAGDVNGDGIDDLIIGSPYADPNNQALGGESYVVFGRNTGFGTSLELLNLNGTNGFTLKGIDSDDVAGFSVSSAGDVNGDGINDLIIGAYGGDPNGENDAGESYVVFGKNTSFTASLELSALNGTNGFVINGIDADDFAGISVSSAGDVNGDGIDDLIIGASGADPDGTLNAGESYVVFGKNTGFASSLELSALDGTDGLVINGVNNWEYSGSSVSSAGDVNGDGLDDLIIGAYNSNPDSGAGAGKSYVVLSLQTNTSPEITTNSQLEFAENGTLAINLDASDNNNGENSGLTYSLSGGADQFLFAINETTGELSFLAPPNFEAPLDSDANNNFQVQVTVTDAGGLTDNQEFSITVTDVNNTPEEIQEGALSLLDTNINRFQNQDIPGTFIYAGEVESQQIRENFPNFVEEGVAFRVADEAEGDLLPFYRFQSTVTPGTYLYAGEEERASINQNFSDSFVEEGFAFAAYGCGSGVGDTVSRFQNSDRPGTYLYAGAEERTSILSDFPNFVEEGCAFHADL